MRKQAIRAVDLVRVEERAWKNLVDEGMYCICNSKDSSFLFILIKLILTDTTYILYI